MQSVSVVQAQVHGAESADLPRLSPITKMWPSGTGPAVQSQLPVIGPLHATPLTSAT